MQIILSFDVEEHFRIEAAARLTVGPGLKAHYGERLETAVQWLLDHLARAEAQGTFFIVGQVAQQHRTLVQAIHRAGHEVASHGWDHQRVHRLNPDSFREDVRRSKDALEQVTGHPVMGYRAPTFSIVRETAWALDVLAELDMVYDSSIYPVWHDRYGVLGAPRGPFLVEAAHHTLLEFPLATLRFLRMNLPTGGGGYFRLLPLAVLERSLRQMARHCLPAVAMLYFHPWEFDPDQPRLPLGRLNGFRTYVGIKRSRRRLIDLLARHRFVRAIDVAKELDPHRAELPCFSLPPKPEPRTNRDLGLALPFARGDQQGGTDASSGEPSAMLPAHSVSASAGQRLASS